MFQCLNKCPLTALPSAPETAVLFTLFPLQHYLFSHTYAHIHAHSFSVYPTSVPLLLLLLSLSPLFLSLSLKGSPLLPLPFTVSPSFLSTLALTTQPVWFVTPLTRCRMQQYAPTPYALSCIIRHAHPCSSSL